MFQIEAAYIGTPQQIQVRLSLSVPPQPEPFGLAPALAAWQPFYLHQDHRSPHDGGAVATISFARLSRLGVQPRPGPHLHLAVASVLCEVLCRRFVPALWVLEVELLAMYERSPNRSSFQRRRVGV